ncbi:MAG: hypothetical protein KME21_30525 [Desmonostoc vinosum HA7617-LM4]|nr:hypothetical protein [Desmonostoc vinosum HA7617-LM4]
MGSREWGIGNGELVLSEVEVLGMGNCHLSFVIDYSPRSLISQSLSEVEVHPPN